MLELKGIDARLAQREATVPALRPDCAKQIIWAGQPEEVTEMSVVFIHGFSATKHELRPLPDMVARDLNANLFLTRLSGHGQDGYAFGAATLQDWTRDTQEALEIASVLGKRVLVIACSTGCTLAALALAQGTQVAGLVQVSPNYGLRHRAAQLLLDVPGIRHFGHLIAGRDRSFDVHSPAHEAYWTTQYPITAVYTMAEAVRAARKADLGRISAPTLVALNPEDQVISPRAARKAMARWDGPVTHHTLSQGPEDDAMGHVMAGEVFSPAQTAPLSARISDWARQI